MAFTADDHEQADGAVRVVQGHDLEVEHESGGVAVVEAVAFAVQCGLVVGAESGRLLGRGQLVCVGEGDDIVAQLEVGGAPFWIAPASSTLKRLSPREINGATGRTTLVVEDPDAVVRRAVAAGATETSPVSEEHGWRLGRILDPFGQEWEIGAPLGAWPPR